MKLIFVNESGEKLNKKPFLELLSKLENLIEKGEVDKNGIFSNSKHGKAKHGAGINPNSAELELLLTDDETIRELNKKFRSKDKATDVLSFSMIERDYIKREAGAHDTDAEIFSEKTVLKDAREPFEHFPDVPKTENAPKNEPVLLGQIVISVERAREQAKELAQSLEEELLFLFTHGLLHILTYDRETPEEEKEMLKEAYRLLGREGK